jgi:hypothetical protein
MLDREELQEKSEAARLKIPGLTPQMVNLIMAEATSLYAELGGDLEPDVVRGPHRGTCRRATILEVVLDAGRLEQQVRRRLKIADADRDHPAVLACHGELAEAIVGPAFVYEYYEVGCS